MNDQEREAVNRKLHEFIGRCWHVRTHPWSGYILQCDDCDEMITKSKFNAHRPDYCSSSSPRSLLEEIVTKVVLQVGSDAYVEELQAICANEMLGKMPWQINDKALGVLETCVPNEAVTATADQIAKACASCIEAEGIGGEDG